ncbi:MAG: hypothetical protein ACWA5K_08700 [bacterium]
MSNKPDESIRAQFQRNLVAIVSIVLAVTGFSYNAYRMELTEANSNVRTAGFALIEKLASLDEVLIYARYSENIDQAEMERLRKSGWVQVIALRDLSYPMPADVRDASVQLMKTWQTHSLDLGSTGGYAEIDNSLESMRSQVIAALNDLD